MEKLLESVIFDFDGLILDTEMAEVRAWNELYDGLNVKIDPNWWTFSIGRGPDQDPVHPFDFIPSSISRELDRTQVIADRNHRRKDLVDQEPPLPGVVELIHSLRNSGVKIAVASSSRHDWVDGHLQRLSLYSLFDAVTCAEDAPFTKPKPDLYLRALERLGASAIRSIAVEDSPAGCTAALAAKMNVIAIPNELTANLEFPPVNATWPSLQGKQPHDLFRILQ